LFHVGMRADSRAQAEALATKLRDAGVPTEVVRAADQNHLTLNRELGAAGDEPTNKILAWLREASAALSPAGGVRTIKPKSNAE
jgi:acetyl esterase/lipase